MIEFLIFFFTNKMLLHEKSLELLALTDLPLILEILQPLSCFFEAQVEMIFFEILFFN